MANSANKISNLAIATTLSANDRVVVLVSPSTSANVKTITVSNFANSVAAQKISNSVPTSNTSNGTPGQVAYSNTHFYLCVANNLWGRTSLTFDW